MKFNGEKLPEKDAESIINELTKPKQYSPEYIKTVKSALNPNHRRKTYTLEELTEKITPENRHEEIDFGIEGEELI